MNILAGFACLAGFIPMIPSALSQQNGAVTCIHEITHGYHYTKPYELSEVAKTMKNRTFRLEVTIVGKSDAHIRLAPHYIIQPGDFYYEIVLGAGANSYSSIRMKPRNYKDLAWESTRNILSPNTPNTFAVVKNNDLIVVSNNQTGKVILSGKDPKAINVKYASFSAWEGVSVFFTFGCREKSPSPQASEDPVDEETLTPAERWRRHFLSQYDPYALPINITDILLVQMSIAINYLSMDSKAGLLTTRGIFNISWTDPKLKWDPNDYEGLSEMFFDTRSIWRPEFTLLDSPKVEESPLSGDFMRVTNAGQVIWKPSSQLVTRCRTDESHNWPKDRYECAIRLALFSHSESIQLSPMSGGLEFPLEPVNSGDLDVKLTSINSETVAEQLPTSPITIAFKLSLQRRMSAFSVLFILPLMAITALTHCGMYLPPSSSARNVMHSVTLLVLAVFLMMEEQILPPGKTIPLIMKLTSGAFILAVFHLIYSTIISCLMQSKFPVPKRLLEIISAKWVNYVLFCPLDMYDTFSSDGQEPSEPELSTSCESQWHSVLRFFDKVAQFISMLLLGVLYIMLMTL